MRRALPRSSHKQSPFREPQPAEGPIAHLYQPADRQKIGPRLEFLERSFPTVAIR